MVRKRERTLILRFDAQKVNTAFFLPPEFVLSRLVGSFAADEEGAIQCMDHFLMQLMLGVQIIDARHQLTEPMAEGKFGARRLSGMSVGALTAHGPKELADFLHPDSKHKPCTVSVSSKARESQKNRRC